TSERGVGAVRDVSFKVGRGETIAIVGESGSGKSVTALSLMRLGEHGGGTITSGGLEFQRPGGQRIDLAHTDAATMRAIRGAEIAMIFQEPMTSLNPVYTVGEQIAESIRLHQGKDHGTARREALRMLEQVRIPEATQDLDRHPHQLSGGMRQRVMIAMALSCKPALLIADEPTTALDVTIQAQILELVRTLQDEMHMAVIFITHDMGVVAEVAERVLVMYQGEKVEEGAAEAIFHAPRDPDGVPGSLRLSRPAAHGRVFGGRAALCARHRSRRRSRGARRVAALARRTHARARQALSARILGRTASAHRHRPRAGAATE